MYFVIISKLKETCCSPLFCFFPLSKLKCHYLSTFYRHQSNLDPSKVQTQLSESAKSKVISTRIRVARNLSMFPLNPGGKMIHLCGVGDDTDAKRTFLAIWYIIFKFLSLQVPSKLAWKSWNWWTRLVPTSPVYWRVKCSDIPPWAMRRGRSSSTTTIYSGTKFTLDPTYKW